MTLKFTFAGAALAALLATTAAQAEDVIGYITKSATNAGWMMINQGAEDAAKEEGVKLVAVGPSFQGDLSSQLEVFENLVAQGVKAIGIAPVDSAGIAPAVADAMAAGIAVIAIDTGVSGADVTSAIQNAAKGFRTNHQNPLGLTREDIGIGGRQRIDKPRADGLHIKSKALSHPKPMLHHRGGRGKGEIWG